MNNKKPLDYIEIGLWFQATYNFDMRRDAPRIEYTIGLHGHTEMVLPDYDPADLVVDNTRPGVNIQERRLSIKRKKLLLSSGSYVRVHSAYDLSDNTLYFEIERL